MVQAMLLNNLGGLQLLQGKSDAALLSFGAALEQSPSDPTARYNRAQLFVRRKDYKAALTDFALLLSAHPRNELYLYQRAMLYLLTKEYDLAENDLKTIIEGNGESLKARIGYALLETMRGRYDEAERLYSYLTDKLPRNAEVYEGRARMFLARGMRGFAQRDINLAFEYARGKAPATLYRLRAELNEALGNKKEAQEDLRQAESRERNAGIQ
jgi:tetratricopeptide repeat protein